MSNATEDEKSLLEAIKGAVGTYPLLPRISSRIYPYTSYILKNVTALKLDGKKMAAPIISGERIAESIGEDFDFSSRDFKDISFILKEIERASSTEADEHKLALSLPRILRLPRGPSESIYSMNFILVGTLAAFAVTHGIWLLVLKFIFANSSKEDITIILKKVEGLFISLRRNLGKKETGYHCDFYLYISILASSFTRMPTDCWESINSLYSLIKAMFDVVSIAHMFLQDEFEFISKDLKDEFDSLMLLSIYWVTRGTFASSFECDKLPKNGFIIHDSQKLSYICDKLILILKRLQTLESTGKQYMEDEKTANAYQIPDRKRKRIYDALMALFGQPKVSDFMLTSRTGKTKDLYYVTWKCKTLLLLISGLDISSNVITFLEDIYVESLQKADCDFIWLPIYSDPQTSFIEKQYTKLLERMPWFAVLHSNVITEKTKKFIRDVWKFHKKPIMVVLNENGDVVNPNAIYMMCIWGSKAFPFTKIRERSLWKDEGDKRLPTPFSGVDQNMSSMFQATKWVIMYGGTEIEWIEKFITCILGISVDSGTSIEMMYVGKNDESIRGNIVSSKLIDTFNSSFLDSQHKWYFWTWLESLLISRYQVLTASELIIDSIFQEVKKLLSYASTESWACLWLPSSDIPIHGLGNIMLQGFLEYDMWKQYIHAKDFDKILKTNIEQVRKRVSDPRCSNIVLNTDNKDVVRSITCPNCNYIMEKKIQYRCCHTNDELQ